MIKPSDAQVIVNEMKSLLDMDINLMDGNGIIIASTNQPRIGTLHEGAQKLLREGLDALVVTPDDTLSNTLPGINFPIRSGGKATGVIGVTGASREMTAFGAVIKRMIELMLENLQKKEDRALMDNARLQFVEHWLFSSSVDYGDLEIRGKLLDVDVNCPRFAVIIETRRVTVPDDRSASDDMLYNLAVRYLKTRVETDPQSFCFLINSRIVILLNEGDRERVQQLVQDFRADIMKKNAAEVYCGVSERARSGLEIRDNYSEAKFACRISANLAEHPTVFYGSSEPEFVAKCLPEQIRASILRATYANCSASEQKEIVETLKYYFMFDGNIQAAADTLFIHRNTFQYRLKKVAEKTGLQVKNPKDVFLLYLSVVLYDEKE